MLPPSLLNHISTAALHQHTQQDHLVQQDDIISILRSTQDDIISILRSTSAYSALNRPIFVSFPFSCKMRRLDSCPSLPFSSIYINHLPTTSVRESRRQRVVPTRLAPFGWSPRFRALAVSRDSKIRRHIKLRKFCASIAPLLSSQPCRPSWRLTPIRYKAHPLRTQSISLITAVSSIHP